MLLPLHPCLGRCTGTGKGGIRRLRASETAAKRRSITRYSRNKTSREWSRRIREEDMRQVLHGQQGSAPSGVPAGTCVIIQITQLMDGAPEQAALLVQTSPMELRYVHAQIGIKEQAVLGTRS